jgi:hypothetical protein
MKQTLPYPAQPTKAAIQQLLETAYAGSQQFMPIPLDQPTLVTMTLDAAEIVRTECLEQLGRHDAEWCKARFTEEFPKLVTENRSNKFGKIVMGLVSARCEAFPTLTPSERKPWQTVSKCIKPFDEA